MPTILNIDSEGHVADVTVTPWTDGSGAPERAGCTQVTLTEAQEALLATAQAEPNGGLTWDGSAFTALAVPDPPATPDPLKTYRQALATAADADPNLSDATKTALANLLTAMAPQGAS